MADKFKTPGCGTFAVILVAVAVVGVAGWWGYLHFLVGPRHARIQELSILMTGHLDMTLLFKEPLPQGDPKDVRVVFKSESLKEGEFTLAWDTLAPRTRAGVQMLKADEPPPLGVPLVVRLPVGEHFEQTMQLSVARTSDFKLTATLFWGGTQQDRASTTVLFNYQPKGN
jgi:hypothetical protein